MTDEVLTRMDVFTKTEKEIRREGGLGRFCERHGLAISTVSSFRHATRKSVPDGLLDALGLEVVYRPRRRVTDGVTEAAHG